MLLKHKWKYVDKDCHKLLITHQHSSHQLSFDFNDENRGKLEFHLSGILSLYHKPSDIVAVFCQLGRM